MDEIGVFFSQTQNRPKQTQADPEQTLQPPTNSLTR